MKVLFDRNGELIALVLAAGCAWAIAAGVMRFAAGSLDALYIPGVAAAAAVFTTWCVWRVIVARGDRLLPLRGMFAGALAGALSHPVFMFAILLREAIAACADRACIVDSVLTAHGMSMVATGSGLFSILGLAVAGPITITVGALGGMVAVVLSRGSRRHEGNENVPGDGLFGDLGA